MKKTNKLLKGAKPIKTPEDQPNKPYGKTLLKPKKGSKK